MNQFEGCQLPCLPKMSEGRINSDEQSLKFRIKRALAVPWNYHVKRWLKMVYKRFNKLKKNSISQDNHFSQEENSIQMVHLKAEDIVRVRSLHEIEATLDTFHEFKGCAFLPYMAEYCDSTQTVLQPVQRFLDERDYKVKKTSGVVLLKNVTCKGTPVFGKCDRACHLFWREEWLEKIN